MSRSLVVEAHPAATVVLLRDAVHGCEALLVRRSPQLAFHGGAWAFPGGRIDPQDYVAPDSTDIVAAARNAAAREAREEAAVAIEPQALVPFSRWVTPEGLPKRFDAWFFAARATTDNVRVDGGEIHEHRWLRPSHALAAQNTREIELPPPTFVTLAGLARFRTVAEALSVLAEQPFETFVPRLHIVPEGACILYAGDVAYESGTLDEPGGRHRLWMLNSGWRYERSAELERAADVWASDLSGPPLSGFEARPKR